ncbi:hypothetical protein PDG61_16835 [Mycolicibacterium sp. BiH015]|uniref:hypothetical protein n=1 Tax=Mycolicibacterium sp. BiH015 TaxID=3018808 RepID=UPI0022E09A14|nr:hypothetical protein [Mycolicibacterium sp. BiH015]MDA2892588.1 hypothetical protein [Mycolicibacterium sp. BiH015]
MPNPDQISTAIRDFERALAGPTDNAFNPSWALAGRVANTQPALFDPMLNPELAQRAHDLHRQLRGGKGVQGHWSGPGFGGSGQHFPNVLFHYPMKPTEGASHIDLSKPDDVIVVFASDVTETGAEVYVLSDVPIDGTEGAVETHFPADVFVRDGKPVVRLSDVFSLCGGRTILVPQQVGMFVYIWEMCEHCHDAALDTAKASMAREIESARAAVGLPTEGAEK